MSTIPATGISNPARTIRMFGRAGCCTLLLVLAALNQGIVAGEADANSDDGWRRTKNGWEHISTWPTEAIQQLGVNDVPATPTQLSPTSERWQRLHPGLLAVGLCLAAGFALRIPRASTSS